MRDEGQLNPVAHMPVTLPSRTIKRARARA